ncbi:hypothetical protein PsorP6_012945 [Peronosclerospora sorghi]|uniref:Uncharacterized protein n=1 Tax=Peronosclerospora sorghi TaxID=230839 RepID=A0ACC0WG78_9STRA|nr:hypothetical protein PsorP6_012945 [Peronosclerospora sorghi]
MGETFFVPYVYVPSGEADYVKLVTSWGNINLNKGFMKQFAISVTVVLLTVMLWRCTARLNANLKKNTVAKEAQEYDEEEKDEEIEEEDDKESQPDEKRVKRGEHSYYYMHEHTKTKDNETMVSSYGWSDNKKSVSIYLTDNVVRDMKEEQLRLNWTTTSLSMNLLAAVGDDNPAKSLEISQLFQEIASVSWTVSKETLTIVLTKAQEKPWTSLNGAARKMEDHIRYDDAFYD